VNRHEPPSSKRWRCPDYDRVARLELVGRFWHRLGCGEKRQRSRKRRARGALCGNPCASLATTNVANDAVALTGTITASAPLTLTEVGAFDAAGTGSPPTGGNMNLYSDFAVLNLSIGDSLNYTLRLTFT
jgi:hypothetical protein